jgi:hypothetical protein
VGFFTMEGASRVCFSHSIFCFFSPAVVEGHLVRRNGSPMLLCLWLVGVFCGVFTHACYCCCCYYAMSTFHNLMNHALIAGW